jgi:hypothetical protein
MITPCQKKTGIATSAATPRDTTIGEPQSDTVVADVELRAGRRSAAWPFFAIPASILADGIRTRS